jgi:hypothetical protein
MLLDLSTSLRVGGKFLPERLVSAGALARLGRIAPILPDCIALGTFEVRLDGSEQVDYQVCFTVGSGVRKRLVELSLGPESERAGPGWRRSLEFLRHWSTPGSLIYVNSPAAWLEFDCRLEDPAPPAPFAFFSLRPPWEDVRIPPKEMAETIDEGFRHLAGGRLDPSLGDAIHRTLASVSAGRLIHAALRPVGDGQVARLIVRIPVAEMAASLKRRGWSHPVADIVDLVARYCTSKLVQTIQLDVSPSGLGARVGVEFFYESSPLQDRRWSVLFDKLVADGACTPERRSQMERWVGTRAPDDVSPVYRGLLIKVVCVPGAPLEAKAYLPFCVDPRFASGPLARSIDGNPAVGT